MIIRHFFEIILIDLLMMTLVSSYCGTFKNPPRQGTITCSPSCLKEKGEVEGTFYYHKDSNICFAAIHAGIIPSNISASVDVTYETSKKLKEFWGTVRNRIKSNSIKKRKQQSYIFPPSSRWIPEQYHEASWLTDVYMIHNSYMGTPGEDVFWMTCLWEETFPDTSKDIYRWNHQKINTGGLKVYTKTMFVTRTFVSAENDNNLNVFTCRGRTPFQDVRGIMNRPYGDRVLPEKTHYLLAQKENLEVNLNNTIDKSYEIVKLSSKKKFDSNENKFRKQNIEITDFGIYEIQTRGSINSHFEVIEKECPDGMFGSNCERSCQDCKNGGVCHPLFGACICKPGFNGTTCENRCRLDTFGSNCQFNCSRNLLRKSINKRSKSDCLGLTFVLPNPMSSTCAFGYGGFFCNETINFVFPYLENPPIVSLKDKTTVVVSFAEWTKGGNGGGGDNYGIPIKSYEIQQLENGIWKRTWTIHKGNPLECNLKYIQANKIHSIRVVVILADEGRKNSSPKNIKKFSLPCYEENKENLSMTLAKKDGLAFRATVPLIQEGFKQCAFELEEADLLYSRTDSKKRHFTSTLSEEIRYQFMSLNPGVNYKINFWCENSIGRCPPTTKHYFTLPDLQPYVIYEDFVMTVSYFYIFNLSTTDFKVFEMENPESKLSKNEEKILLKEKKEFKYDSTSMKYISEFKELEQRSPFNMTVVLYYQTNDGRKKSESVIFLSHVKGNTPYVGLLIAVFIILALLLIVLILRKRISRSPFFERMSRPSKALSFTSLPTSSGPNPEEDLGNWGKKDPGTQGYENIDVDTSKEGVSYTNINESPSEYKNLNIAANHEEDFEMFINSLIYSPKATNDFMAIPKDCGKSSAYAFHPRNKLKNRYKNNLPYDDTRVVLSTIGNDPYSDYINASIMKGVAEGKWYICTQGPKESNLNTIKDFWRMVYETESSIIIMVAKFVENGKSKVGRYFDFKEALIFDEISVRVTERFQGPHFIRSIIEVTYNFEVPEVKNITHYQFLKWPDHGIPNQIFPLATMVQSAMEEFKQGAIIIHCSAGVGRTGTVLMSMLLKEVYETASWIDPISLLKRMRDVRGGLIENIHQYNLSLLILNECIFGKIGIVRGDDYEGNWNHYINNANKLYERMLRQNILQSYIYGMNHIHFNRDPSILPSDNFAVLFGSDEIENNNDYINAIILGIEENKNSVIVTEHPLSTTMYNFWKMVYIKQCSYLILLNSIEESEDFPSILPVSSGSILIEDLQINVAGTEQHPRNLGLQYEVQVISKEYEHIVTAIQVLNWSPSEDVPSKISVVEEVAGLLLEHAGESNPFLLVCSDGVTACGLIVTAANLIYKVQLYQETSVYKSALQMRRYRPQFITSVGQFIGLYEVLKVHLENNAIYQNFK